MDTAAGAAAAVLIRFAFNFILHGNSPLYPFPHRRHYIVPGLTEGILSNMESLPLAIHTGSHISCRAVFRPYSFLLALYPGAGSPVSPD